MHSSSIPSLRIHSLSMKLTIAIICWLVIALLFSVLSLNLSWDMEKGGEIINQTGSLRMRMYHMVALISQPNQQEEIRKKQIQFEAILDQVAQASSHSWLTRKDPQELQKIEELKHASQMLLSRLMPYAQKGHLPLTQLKEASQFIEQIDLFVKAYEIRNTEQIQLLRLLQLFLICMVILSAFVAIYLLNRLVIQPLKTIHSGIQSISQGQWTTRIQMTGDDEFALVSAGFNAMAAGLEDLYTNLENKVTEKTLALAQRNKELNWLYKMTSFLHESHTVEEMTQHFLMELISASQADAGSIRLTNKSRQQLNFSCSIGLPEQLLDHSQCRSHSCLCGQASMQLTPEMQQIPIAEMNCSVPCQSLGFQYLAVFQIHYGEQLFGIVTLYFQQPIAASVQEKTLISTLCNQLGVALENQRLALRDQQFAVVEERHLMAQGLHDSIAQSLSFLNLQVQMLEAALKQGEKEKAKENLAFIQEGVQECYEDVRELLLNFRAKISKEEFSEALQTILHRFKKQTKIAVSFSSEGHAPDLTPQQQLQVLFILQEALSNVRKHAQATEVRIQIHNQQHFTLTISDNGIGFDAALLTEKQLQHIGLSIIQERAARIQAQVAVHSHPQQGTQLVLRL